MVCFMCLGGRGYSVNYCSVCSEYCVIYLNYDACSSRCCLSESMLVFSCKCRLLVPLVQPVAIISVKIKYSKICCTI